MATDVDSRHAAELGSVDSTPTAEHIVRERFIAIEDTARKLESALANHDEGEARTRLDELIEQLAKARRTAQEAARFADLALPFVERFAQLQDALRKFPDDPEQGLNRLRELGPADTEVLPPDNDEETDFEAEQLRAYLTSKCE